MAPPRHRRPGYSRKAQIGLFAGYVIAVVGAVAGLLLVLLSRVDPAGFRALSQTASELFAPVARGGTTVSGGIGSLDERIGAYVDAANQNRDLRRQLDRTRLALLEAQALKLENMQLKGLLKLSADNPETVVVTRLLGSTSSGPRRFATLDAGRNRGIRPGMPLRAPEGLIGRVLDVGPTLARVLLISDASSIVPVRRVRDGFPALATGLADGNVDVRALNAGLDAFERGDVFVTSGIGGLFQPNIPVAVVLTVNSDGAIARPLAHPARVSAVLVERAFRDTANANALPPVATADAEEGGG